MDVLSDVLKVVKLDGALFFHGEFSAPWCFRSSESAAITAKLSPHAGHLIIYHFLTEGRAYAKLDRGSQSCALWRWRRADQIRLRFLDLRAAHEPDLFGRLAFDPESARGQ